MGKRILTITYNYYQNERAVPHIKLLGGWLEELGFKIGEKVEVYTSEDKPDELLIRKINDKKC